MHRVTAVLPELAECVDIAATDIENMVKFAKDNAIDLVMVAPDDPLVLGMVDAMEKKRYSCIRIARCKCRYNRERQGFSKNL